MMATERMHEVIRLYKTCNPIFKLILMQYRVSKGLKLFGQQGSAAVDSKPQQFHDQKLIDPKLKLSINNKKAALEYPMFLKEKQ